MPAEFTNAVVAGTFSVVVAASTYWLTKKRERDAELRREKLDHYKAFILSLSGIITNESSPAGQIAFAQACNNLLLFAPQPVIEALQKFQIEARISNPNPSKEKHDRLLSLLLIEIRNDLNVRPKDDPGSFKAWLWASGVIKDGAEQS
jgi:hypothetical protein